MEDSGKQRFTDVVSNIKKVRGILDKVGDDITSIKKRMNMSAVLHQKPFFHMRSKSLEQPSTKRAKEITSKTTKNPRSDFQAKSHKRAKSLSRHLPDNKAAGEPPLGGARLQHQFRYFAQSDTNDSVATPNGKSYHSDGDNLNRCEFSSGLTAPRSLEDLLASSKKRTKNHKSRNIFIESRRPLVGAGESCKPRHNEKPEVTYDDDVTPTNSPRKLSPKVNQGHEFKEVSHVRHLAGDGNALMKSGNKKAKKSAITKSKVHKTSSLGGGGEQIKCCQTPQGGARVATKILVKEPISPPEINLETLKVLSSLGKEKKAGDSADKDLLEERLRALAEVRLMTNNGDNSRVWGCAEKKRKSPKSQPTNQGQHLNIASALLEIKDLKKEIESPQTKTGKSKRKEAAKKKYPQPAETHAGKPEVAIQSPLINTVCQETKIDEQKLPVVQYEASQSDEQATKARGPAEPEIIFQQEANICTNEPQVNVDTPEVDVESTDQVTQPCLQEAELCHQLRESSVIENIGCEKESTQNAERIHNKHVKSCLKDPRVSANPSAIALPEPKVTTEQPKELEFQPEGRPTSLELPGNLEVPSNEQESTTTDLMIKQEKIFTNLREASGQIKSPQQKYCPDELAIVQESQPDHEDDACKAFHEKPCIIVNTANQTDFKQTRTNSPKSPVRRNSPPAAQRSPSMMRLIRRFESPASPKLEQPISEFIQVTVQRLLRKACEDLARETDQSQGSLATRDSPDVERNEGFYFEESNKHLTNQKASFMNISQSEDWNFQDDRTVSEESDDSEPEVINEISHGVAEAHDLTVAEESDVCQESSRSNFVARKLHASTSWRRRATSDVITRVNPTPTGVKILRLGSSFAIAFVFHGLVIVTFLCALWLCLSDNDVSNLFRRCEIYLDDVISFHRVGGGFVS